jgi:hypothetical protein
MGVILSLWPHFVRPKSFEGYQRKWPSEIPPGAVFVPFGNALGTLALLILYPWQAALSPAVAFTLGALGPSIAILLLPVSVGVLGAFLPPLRVAFGGAAAMLVTYRVGHIGGTTL